MKDMILEIIDSYERRILIVNEIIEGSQELIDNYRSQRESMSEELRDNLARAQSLRRKDFDRMMNHISDHHNEREGEVREMLRRYVKEHQQMVISLRSLLSDGQKNGASAENEGLKKLRGTFEKIKKEQAERELEVKEILATYQFEQDSYAEIMNSLLRKGGEVRIPEVKAAVQNISLRNIKNQNRHLNLKKEVHHVN